MRTFEVVNGPLRLLRKGNGGYFLLQAGISLRKGVEFVVGQPLITDYDHDTGVALPIISSVMPDDDHQEFFILARDTDKNHWAPRAREVPTRIGKIN